MLPISHGAFKSNIGRPKDITISTYRRGCQIEDSPKARMVTQRVPFGRRRNSSRRLSCIECSRRNITGRLWSLLRLGLMLGGNTVSVSSGKLSVSPPAVSESGRNSSSGGALGQNSLSLRLVRVTRIAPACRSHSPQSSLASCWRDVWVVGGEIYLARCGQLDASTLTGKFKNNATPCFIGGVPHSVRID